MKSETFLTSDKMPINAVIPCHSFFPLVGITCGADAKFSCVSVFPESAGLGLNVLAKSSEVAKRNALKRSPVLGGADSSKQLIKINLIGSHCEFLS